MAPKRGRGAKAKGTGTSRDHGKLARGAGKKKQSSPSQHEAFAPDAVDDLDVGGGGDERTEHTTEPVEASDQAPEMARDDPAQPMYQWYIDDKFKHDGGNIVKKAASRLWSDHGRILRVGRFLAGAHLARCVPLVALPEVVGKGNLYIEWDFNMAISMLNHFDPSFMPPREPAAQEQLDFIQTYAEEVHKTQKPVIGKTLTRSGHHYTSNVTKIKGDPGLSMGSLDDKSSRFKIVETSTIHRQEASASPSTEQAPNMPHDPARGHHNELSEVDGHHHADVASKPSQLHADHLQGSNQEMGPLVQQTRVRSPMETSDDDLCADFLRGQHVEAKFLLYILNLFSHRGTECVLSNVLISVETDIEEALDTLDRLWVIGTTVGCVQMFDSGSYWTLVHIDFDKRTMIYYKTSQASPVDPVINPFVDSFLEQSVLTTASFYYHDVGAAQIDSVQHDCKALVKTLHIIAGHEAPDSILVPKFWRLCFAILYSAKFPEATLHHLRDYSLTFANTTDEKQAMSTIEAPHRALVLFLKLLLVAINNAWAPIDLPKNRSMEFGYQQVVATINSVIDSPPGSAPRPQDWVELMGEDTAQLRKAVHLQTVVTVIVDQLLPVLNEQLQEDTKLWRTRKASSC